MVERNIMNHCLKKSLYIFLLFWSYISFTSEDAYNNFHQEQDYKKRNFVFATLGFLTFAAGVYGIYSNSAHDVNYTIYNDDLNHMVNVYYRPGCSKAFTSHRGYTFWYPVDCKQTIAPGSHAVLSDLTKLCATYSGHQKLWCVDSEQLQSDYEYYFHGNITNKHGAEKRKVPKKNFLRK